MKGFIPSTKIGLSKWIAKTAAALLLAVQAFSPATAQTCDCSSFSLINPNFEIPGVSAGTFNFIAQASVPGWKTTDPTGVIEIWGTGFQGVPAASGANFAELNAHNQASLYQDLATCPGQTYTWKASHRGRSGSEQAQLEFGPPGGPYTVVQVMTDGTSAWGNYSGSYTIPAGQATTRVRLTSNYPSGGAGNFVDNFLMTPASCATDDDGDLFSEAQGDCNDADNTIYPGAPELCDGKDNNCNSQIDEVFASITAGGSLAICGGGSVLFTANSGLGYTYQWKLNGNPISGATSQTYSATAPGTYTVTTSIGGTCTATSTGSTVLLNLSPTITASSNSPINAGSTLNLNASGGLSYSWSGPNGFTSSSSSPSITNATTLASGTYTVIGYGLTGLLGCGGMATVNVTVNDNAKALHFDGQDDWVNVTNMPAINAIPVTLEAMIKPELRPEGDIFYPNNILSNDIPGNYGLGFGANVYATGSRIVVEYKNGFREIINPAGLVAGQWIHIAVVYNNGNLKVYVNGNLVDNFNYAQAPLNGNTYMFIGKHNDDTGYGTRRFFKGAIDEVRVWNRALCAAEINSQYSCKLNGIGNSLFANYSFDQGFANANNSSVTTLLDATGNGGNGVLNSFTLNGATSNWIAPGGTNTTCSPYLVGDINLKGNSVTIYSGTTATTTSNNTDFGTTTPGGAAITKSFNIENTGTGSLTVTGLTITGATQFAASGITFPVTIASGNNVSFNIAYTPPAVNTTSNATVSIASNDCDEGTYTFNIKAVAVCPTIAISGTPVAPICPGGNNGSITLNVPTTGTAPFMYSKDNGATYVSGNVFGSLTASTYTMKIKDANGCTSASQNFTVPAGTDNTKPVVGSCAGNTTVNATTGVCGAVVNYAAATATDNCTASGALTYTYSTPSGSVFPIGTTTVTVTAKDASNNISLPCTFTVTVNDNIAPVVNCPSNVMVNAAAGMCSAVATYNVTATDNCPSGITYTYSIPSGSTFAVGTTAVTVTAKDASGNVSAPCTFNVVVADNQAPSIVCPSNISVNNDAGICGAVVSYTVTGTDNCTAPGALVYTYSQAPGSVFPVGTTNVTVSAKDAAGNTSASCSFSVTVTDTQAPTINCPANITVNNDFNQCGAVVNFNTSATDNCGGVPVMTLSQDPNTFFPVGTTTVTITAKDAFNNISNCSFTVTVVDNQQPYIAAPALVTVNSDANSCYATNVSFGNPVTFDNCGIASVTNNGPAAYPVGTTLVTWTVTDIHGNIYTAQNTVLVNDVIAPTVTAPANVTVSTSSSCNAVSVNMGGPIATDNCTIASITNDAPVSFPVGSTTVTWVIKDAAGNTTVGTQTVTVIDSTAPVMLCNNIAVSNKPDSCKATVSYPLPSVLDNCSGTGSFAPIKNGSFESDYTGWTVSSSNSALGTFGILTTGQTVMPNTNLYDFANNIMEIQTSPGLPVMGTPTDGNKMAVLLVKGAANHRMYQDITIPTGTNMKLKFDLKYTNHDVFDPVNQYFAVVLKNPTTDAVLATLYKTMPGDPLSIPMTAKSADITAFAGQSVRLEIMEAKFNNYFFDVMLDNVRISGYTTLEQIAGLPSGSSFPVGTTVNTYKATDESGNSSICSFNVVVADTQKPKLTVPADMIVNADNGMCSAAITLGNATATDNCAIASIAHSPVSPFSVGVNSVLWTATDVNGNTTTATQKVTVIDNQAPIVNCPANAVVSCDASTATSATGVATATDNCAVSSVTYADASTQDANVNNIGHYNYTITRTWTATDASSNTSTCVQTISVQDVVAPAITCPAGVAVSCSSSTATSATGTATATDACGSATVTYTDASTQDANINNAAHYNYTITRTWKAVDVSGNIATCAQVITVNDVTAPVISAPANAVVSCQSTNTSMSGVATATDNCSPVTITYTDATTQDPNVNNAAHYNYVISRTWTATDVAGNVTTSVQTVTVQDVTAPFIILPANVTVNCDATASTGTATAVENCSSYTITSSDASTQDANINNAGHYNYVVTRTWTATDVSGNTVSAPQTITVQDIAAPVLSVPANTTVSCNGASSTVATGVATATDNCSPVTITYADASNQNANPNSAGYYNYIITRTWTATDVAGNQSTQIQTIAVQDVVAPFITLPANITVSCSASTSVSATGNATAIDNCSPVTISHTDISTQNANPNNMGYYNYTITRTFTATDASGNAVSAAQTITVQDNTPPVITCPANAAVNCNTSNTGTANATDNCSAVVVNYTDVSTYDANNANPNHYNYVITRTWKATDVSGNYNTCTQTITVNTISLTSTAINAACNGANTGSVDVTVLGGATPFTYSWSNSASTEDITGVGAGTYTVTVTDANGCTATATATIAQPTAIAVTATVTNATCNANNGTITLNVTGGTAPYTYNWGGGVTTQNRTALAGGTYNVTITDANGCTVTKSATVNQATGNVAVNGTVTNVNCNGGNNGAIALSTPTGGTAPYTYSWSTGATTQNISGRIAGTYTVTVTDVNGCTTVKSFTITQPAPIVLSTVINNVSCNGGDNGSIDLSVTGGTGPYTYNWNLGGSNNNNNNCWNWWWWWCSNNCNNYNNNTTTQDVNDLSEGSYSVTVTDNKGCTVTASYTITEPDAIVLTATKTNVTCKDGNNGTITLTVNGGTAPYAYSWSNGSSWTSNTTNVTTQNRGGLDGGTYTVKVTDAKGCTKTLSVSITEPTSGMTASATVSNVDCKGGNGGAINLTVSGGSSPYTYSWTGGATTQDLSNKIAGTYTVTITDANGCSLSKIYTITEPSTALALNATVTNISCNGDDDGAITLSITGGTGSYTYKWNNNSTSKNRSNLSAGTYSVTVKDANGCTVTGSYTITQPTAITLSATKTNVTCKGGNNGTITLSVSGGTAPYTYNWYNGSSWCSNNNNVTTQNRSGLEDGTYTVKVTDANGCTKTLSVSISEPSNGIAASTSVTNVTCKGSNTGGINLTVSGGTSPYTYSWTGGTTTKDLSNKAAGAYTVVITDANGCTLSKSATITEPATALTLTAAVTNISCYGEDDGAITLTISGGTSPYSYKWNNNSTSKNRTGLVAGTYSVIVTDDNGCTTTGSYTITQPTSSVSISGVVTHVSCNNGTNGAINITVSGGSAPYTYNWYNGSSWCSNNNNSTSQNRSNLDAGSYTVKVTDNKGCTKTMTFTVTEPNSISGAIAVSPTVTVTNGQSYTIYKGYGPQSVTLSASVSGGTPGYTYSWSPTSGVANPTSASTSVSPTSTTTYTVTITDSKGCSKTVTKTIRVVDVRGNNDKIIICHNGHTQQVSVNAVPAHLAHGDNVGECEEGCKTSGAGNNTDHSDEHEIAELAVSEINVYPNPTTGLFRVTLPASSKNAEVVVTDIEGKLIERRVAQGVNTIDFNLGHVAAGTYTIQVNISGQHYQSKVVIQ